jgi:16S rRNA (uracil1498-N3)-methyltransferase
MQFIYHNKASQQTLVIENDTFHHIFTTRRLKDTSKVLYLRNLKEDNLYTYKISSLEKKKAILELIDTKLAPQKADKSLHIGWCVIDPKEIEKSIVVLNELGVEKISFIYCTKSQKQYKINYERLNKILINSCQQCGRSDLMVLEQFDSLDEYVKIYDDSVMLDFCDNTISNNTNISSIIIGAEGGFCAKERELVSKKVGLKNKNIFKSSSIVISISSKLLL